MFTLLILILIVDIVVIYRQYDFLRYLFYKYIKPFLTWRILVCYLPIWFIASGWSMVGIVIGRGVFWKISVWWQAFLWMPWAPEKLITIPLTIWLHRKLFPNHSTSQLDKLLEKEKQKNAKNKLFNSFAINKSNKN